MYKKILDIKNVESKKKLGTKKGLGQKSLGSNKFLHSVIVVVVVAAAAVADPRKDTELYSEMLESYLFDQSVTYLDTTSICH